ncbi:MAG: TonB-dependent receptor [Balneolaceae bacterium]|nr:TonB-dependent receptor [Balneolaceae bacterium]
MAIFTDIKRTGADTVRWWCTTLLLFVSVLSAVAQQPDREEERYSFDFRGAELTTALDEIARSTGIDLVYDPALVKNHSVYRRIKDQPVSKLLKSVLSGTSLDYVTLSSGTIVIVETVEQNPAFGSYHGKVVDSRTGDPLPGASVMLADASGGTSTSETGNFTINRLVSGTYTIVFSYIGYEPVKKTVRIRPNSDLRQKVELEPKPVDFTPIVVTGHLPQLPMQREDTETVAPDTRWEPNSRLDNAIHSLSLLPGVQYGLPMTDLHLQGSQGGEHRIMLDGAPIYNPYSFGKMFSAFSPFAINRIEVHKAGFGASRGSQIAGLVNLTHDLGSTAHAKPEFQFQADPLSVNGRADLSLATGRDSSSINIMAAGRTNYWNIFQEPSMQQTLREWDTLDPLVTNLLISSDDDASVYEPRKHQSDLQFHDLHLAARYDIDPYRSLTSTFYAGRNYVSTDLLRQAPQNPDLPTYLYARDEYRWNNLMGQIRYNHFVTSRLDLRSQLSFSTNRFRHRYLLGTSDNPSIPGLSNVSGTGALADATAFEAFQEAGNYSQIPTQRNENKIQHLTFKTSGTYSITPRFNLESGLKFDMVRSRVDLSDLFYLPTLSDQESTFYSGFINSNWRIGNYWKLTAGNRFTRAEPINRFYLEPRASIQYDRPDSGIGYWTARLSGGLYRQFINHYDITNPGPTSLVPSFAVWSHTGTREAPKAWHLSGSYHLEPSPASSIDLELFYKWQPNTYTVSYNNLLRGIELDRSEFSAFTESTEMTSLGASLRVNHSLYEGDLKLLLGYDFNYNRINLDTQFGRSLPAPWTEPHRFQLRALWRIAPGFSSVIKWQNVLGRSWGFRQSYYNFLFYETGENYGDYYFNAPENDKLSPFHQLDLSLIYTPGFSRFGMDIRLDLINLLDRQNTIDWSLQPTAPGGEEYEIRKRTMPGFSPSLSIEIDF